MSSFDRAVRASLILLAVIGLGACSVEPLYGSGPAGTVVKASLAGIDVAPVDTKIAQDLRNRLLFDLSGTASPAAAPRYSLKLDVASTELALGVTPVQTSPAYSVTVTAIYELVSLATGKIVLRATSRQSASYDRVNQGFANTRAKLDAETRAAQLAADDIHLALSAAAAGGRI